MESVPPPSRDAAELAVVTPLQSQRGDDEPPWPPWTAPAAVGAGFVMGFIGAIVVGLFGALGGSNLRHPTPAVTLISNLVFDLAFVAAALYFSRVRSQPRPADFGFRAVRLRVAVGGVLLAGIGYFVVSLIYANLVKLRGSDKLPSELGVSKSTVALVAATVFVCVVAPIAEEFFFRGFIFGALRRLRIVVAGRYMGPWVAAVLTGSLFGLAHLGSAKPQYLVPLGVLGFTLCLLRWRTRSLYPCMVLHSVNNSLALGINQLNWNAGEICALTAGSVLTIMALTGRLASSAG
ncbi:MAG TPA: type II CAAX endopeptidase family protein [Solirubrobacteraceae bacterium]